MILTLRNVFYIKMKNHLAQLASQRGGYASKYIISLSTNATISFRFRKNDSMLSPL